MKTATLALLASLLACGGGRSIEPVDVPRTPEAVMLFVDNKSWDYVTVFVMISPAVAEEVGRCDAATKCTYALNPQLTSFLRTAGWVWVTYRPQAERRRNVYFDIGRVPTPRPGEIVVAVIANSQGQSNIRVGA